MSDLHLHLIPPDATVADAIRTIESGRAKIALVADGEHRLLGTVTDGDVRRAIIAGLTLDAPVASVMNRSPTVSGVNADRGEMLALMRLNDFRQMPVVDADGRVVSIETVSDLLEPSTRPNPVVLMAGGLGTRLRPLTDDRPKPLIHVGPRPILETVIGGLRSYGFRQIYLSVNYHASMVEEHFGDGSRFDVEITYLHEDEPLGTAGALSLLPMTPSVPTLVMNADLLTRINYANLLDFHIDHRAAATVGVREYEIEVPYGVVELRSHDVTAIVEKPVYRRFVNAGIYVLSPEAVAMVSHGVQIDMPDLIQALLGDGGCVAAFPIREYWMDVGRIDDLERANEEFAVWFS